jgi:hypothetical protein
MMDDAERKASGGKVGYAEGGLLSNPYGMHLSTPHGRTRKTAIEQTYVGC